MTRVRTALAAMTTLAAVTACTAGESGPDASPDNPPPTTPTSSATTPTIPEQTRTPGVSALRLGVMLPRTGDLTHLEPSLQAGVRVAVDEIADDGGVLGRPVSVVRRDSGDGESGVSRRNARRLARKGVAAVIGGVSPQSTFEAFPALQKAAQKRHRGHPDRDSQVVMVSATAMAETYDNLDDDGLAFRTVPSNVLQAAVLAQQVARVNGGDRVDVSVLASTQVDAAELSDRVTEQLSRNGVRVRSTVEYDPTLTGFAPEVREIKQSRADATVVVGAQETAQILRGMARERIGPAHRPVFLVDTNTLDYGRGGEEPVSRALRGMTGIEPGAAVSGTLRDRLRDVEPGLADPAAAPEAYDATMLVALAAQQAGDTTAGAIAREMPEVSSGGQACRGFQPCRVLIGRGVDIDYEGASGPVDLNEAGSPSEATMTILRYDRRNAPVPVDHVAGEVR